MIKHIKDNLKILIECGASGIKNTHNICLKYDIGTIKTITLNILLFN